MSAFDTIIGFDIKCPKCHSIIKGGFQSKSFLCHNLSINRDEYEQLMDKWNDGFYKAYVHCNSCYVSYDLVYDSTTKYRYSLYSLDEHFNVLEEFKLKSNSIEELSSINKVFTF